MVSVAVKQQKRAPSALRDQQKQAVRLSLRGQADARNKINNPSFEVRLEILFRLAILGCGAMEKHVDNPLNECWACHGPLDQNAVDQSTSERE